MDYKSVSGAATSPGGGAAGCFPCATAPRVYAAAPRRGWCATHCWRSRPRPCTWSRHQTREGRGAGGVRRGRRLRLMQRARRLRLRCAPAATVLARARCKHSDSADVGSSAGSTPVTASTAPTACSKAGRAAAEFGGDLAGRDLAAAGRPAPWSQLLTLLRSSSSTSDILAGRALLLTPLTGCSSALLPAAAGGGAGDAG